MTTRFAAHQYSRGAGLRVDDLRQRFAISNFCPLTSTVVKGNSEKTNSSISWLSETTSSSTMVTSGAPPGRRKYQMQCSKTSRAIASADFRAFF